MKKIKCFKGFMEQLLSHKKIDKFLNFIQDSLERDHRKLGKQLNLFDITDDIGAGLILWYPKVGIIRNEKENFWKEEHIKNNYNLVYTPHIGKSNLWEIFDYNSNLIKSKIIKNSNDGKKILSNLNKYSINLYDNLLIKNRKINKKILFI